MKFHGNFQNVKPKIAKHVIKKGIYHKKVMKFKETRL